MEKLKNEYKEKVVQRQVFVWQEGESHMCLNLNATPQKTAGIMNMLEQMVETQKWKALQGVGDTDGKGKLRVQDDETVQHVVGKCEILQGAENFSRHNNALIVLAANFAIGKGLLRESTIWYGDR